MNSQKLYATVGRIAPLYDAALKFNGYERSVRYFISQLPSERDAAIKVLDAGCGTGLYSLAILKRFPNAHVVAFDLDEKLVARLKTKIAVEGYGSRTHLFTADIQEVAASLDDESFDLIVTSGVLEYVPLKETIKKLAALLVIGGYFLSSPVRDTLFGKLVGVVYGCTPYSRAHITQAFEESGLRLQNIITLGWYEPASFKEAQIFEKQ